MKEAHRLQVLQSRFKRHGGSGSKTYRFDQLPEQAQRYFAEHLTYRADEYPAVAFFEHRRHWTLITTQRVLTVIEDQLVEVEASDLIRVNPAFIHEGKSPQQTKTSEYRLRLERRSAQPLILSIEPGLPFWGVYSVLCHLVPRQPRTS